MEQRFVELRERLLQQTRVAIAASVTDDHLIIQAVTMLEQLDQAVNRLVKKTREWTALTNPEFERATTDHRQFLAGVANAIEAPGQASMGALLPTDDREAIRSIANAIDALAAQRTVLEIYLTTVMRRRCPNVTMLAEPIIGAQLLAHAGSLERLANVPSSTIQLFGAETALFRHLRDRRKHRSPKYGVLFNHPLVQRLPQSERGRAARALADKLSLCAKIDRFGGELHAPEYKRELALRFVEWS